MMVAVTVTEEVGVGLEAAEVDSGPITDCAATGSNLLSIPGGM